MTTAARAVLEDCRGALAELVDGLQGGAWRRRWITAVVLLRAVGHILDKIDSRSAKYARPIAAAWSSLNGSKPAPTIFWAFIESERNNILKEYELSAGQGATVGPLGASKPTVTHHYLINSGPFAGRDQRDVVREAIAWWEAYLDAIDKTATS
jgi:hypothetical protein